MKYVRVKIRSGKSRLVARKPGARLAKWRNRQEREADPIPSFDPYEETPSLGMTEDFWKGPQMFTSHDGKKTVRLIQQGAVDPQTGNQTVTYETAGGDATTVPSHEFFGGPDTRNGFRPATSDEIEAHEAKAEKAKAPAKEPAK